MNEQVNSGTDNAAPAPNANPNTPQDTTIPTDTNSTGKRDTPSSTTIKKADFALKDVDNTTQVNPDSGTGGNSQTEDVGQQPMASTATAVANTPLPSTEQAKIDSEVLADALNKELGNDVPSMVNPSVSVLQTDIEDKGPVGAELGEDFDDVARSTESDPKGEGAAPIEESAPTEATSSTTPIGTTDAVQSSASSQSEPSSPTVGTPTADTSTSTPSADLGNDAPIDTPSATPVTNTSESAQDNGNAPPTTDTPTQSTGTTENTPLPNSGAAPDQPVLAAGELPVAAATNDGKNTEVSGGDASNPVSGDDSAKSGGSSDTGNEKTPSAESVIQESNVQPQVSSLDTSATPEQSSNLSGSAGSANANPSGIEEPASAQSVSKGGDVSTDDSSGNSALLPTGTGDPVVDSSTGQKPIVEGEVNGQDNSNGTPVSNTGGSGDTTQPAESSSTSSDPVGSVSSSNESSTPAASSEEPTSGIDVDSDHQPSALSTPPVDSGAKGSDSSGSQEAGDSGTHEPALEAPPDATTTPQASETQTAVSLESTSDEKPPALTVDTPAPDVSVDSTIKQAESTEPVNPAVADIDPQTGEPAVTAPSVSPNETATPSVPEPQSTPGADAPVDAPKQTPNTDVNAPVSPNTQTTDTPGPAPTLPSSADPVSADKTTATSVDSPNPQTEVTNANGSKNPPADTSNLPVLTDVLATPISPADAAALIKTPEPTPPSPVVVNTGVSDNSTAAPATPSPSFTGTPTVPTPTPAAPAPAPTPAPTSHGPTGIAEVDRILEHLPASALGSILSIKNYMTMMAPRKPMDAKTGAQHQVTLFRAITNIINREEEHFETLFTAMLKMFEHGKDDVFQETHVFRFQEAVNLNADEQKGFQRLVNLFKVMGPVQDRNLARKQVRVEESLTHGLTDEGRNRVLSYFDPNGR